MFKKLVPLILFFTVFLLCGCTEKKNNVYSGNKLDIVCTVFPEYDWCREILGKYQKNVNLTYLLGDGVDMHHYQPDADAVSKVKNCDILMYVGGESEKWIDEALAQVPNNNITVVNLLDILGDSAIELERARVRSKKALDPVEETTEPTTVPEPLYDEHPWLSLKHAQTFCTEITEIICRTDPSHADYYRANLESYNNKLSALDKEFRLMFNDCKKHALIFGDRYPFRYFEADYNILCYAPFSTCGTASTAQYDDIVALAKQISYFRTHVVYILESSDTTIADAIIENTTISNQRIEVLNSAQSVTQKQADKGMSYLSIMLGNYDIIEEALNQ
ncbi:MAG: zinc ABC transporter substrate-binding protein [Ruminococcus sp.]|nr:zinc ABC transporter substrate-binding protein [Ruminococcus sp.]